MRLLNPDRHEKVFARIYDGQIEWEKSPSEPVTDETLSATFRPLCYERVQRYRLAGEADSLSEGLASADVKFFYGKEEVDTRRVPWAYVQSLVAAIANESATGLDFFG